DFSAGSSATVAAGAKCYFEGAAASSFNGFIPAIFNATNGGSNSLYGKTKADYPWLQSTEKSGSSWTSSNILDSMLDAQIEHNKLGRQGANEWIVSYDLWGYIAKLLEYGSGAYKHTGT